MNLDLNWKPGSARNHTWVGMDKNGRLGLMYNNGYGWLPTVLLKIPNIKEKLSDLCEYIDGDSNKYINNIDIQGGYSIDLYSSWVYKDYENKRKIVEEFDKQLDRNFKYSTALIGCKMGMFLFEGLEGYSKGEDYPIGYDGKTKMGDYYRFIVPTVFLTIDEIPAPLRNYIVVSDTIDFTADQLFDNDKISEYFPRMYHD
ncbi:MULTISPECIES: hypothetical protein [unclassified Providencia]|uniref:hypothetical protein n=1 Tax=unclassified Providencia TaxID=2633465 RepID=UPI002349D2B1|nr:MULTISPECIES: hypothetical protein [unclassified Providencia]WOC00469.1 hypothetical protein P3L55_03845 [Providencia sp. PROV046]